MTRFARAKGSKASNERVPEASTPWNVMKEDLQKSQNEANNKKERQKIHEERQKNYDEFVKETDAKQEKKWAKFPKTNLKTIKKKPKHNKNLGKITENNITDDMIDELCYKDPKVDGQLGDITKKIEKVLSKKGKTVQQKKNKVKKENVEESADNDAPEEVSAKQEYKIIIKKSKNKKIPLKISSVTTNAKTKEGAIKQSPNKQQDFKNKMHKTNTKTKEGAIKQSPNKQQDFKNKKQNKNKPNNNQKGKFENKNNFDKNNQQGQKRKVRDDKEHKRRKPINNTIIINGETKETAILNGFPVLKSDYDRIKSLRKSLISKGVPRSEVDKTLKLERRKAEKHLSKLKKALCFQCRQTGHVLSDCPLVGNNPNTLIETSAAGICYRCGSTEHSSKQCKVNSDYKFAKCFICREQGHISSQCPDNPKGLYPKGGACKLCGDVTHLKKDCPKYQEAKSNKNSVFLHSISCGNIEDVDESSIEKKKIQPEKKKKIIKF